MVQDIISKKTYFDLLGKLNKREELVFSKIKEIPRMTAVEYARLVFNVEDPNYVRPRITDLKNKGLVKATGQRICQITNNKSNVWECVYNE